MSEQGCLFYDPSENLSVKVITGDCRDILPSLDPSTTAIVTDPPYGCDNNCDYKRFTGGLIESKTFNQIARDDRPFSPKHLLGFSSTTIFGYPYFARLLPLGTLLVWNKRRMSQKTPFLSDGEIAWHSTGEGVYLFHHIWNGFDRASEKGQKTLHPTQKPVAVMRWCIERLNLPKDTLICDPYCGSGSTGLAAIELGYSFLGIEIDENYANIARGRLGC